MDVKRDGGDDGWEEDVALQVDVGDLAGLEGDEKAIDRGAVEEAEDATTSMPQEMKSEYKSEESTATGFEAVGTVQPPPVPIQLHRQASNESRAQTRVDFQTHSLISTAESKRDNTDDGDKTHVARSGEWASTRRSGKRMQPAPRAASERPSAVLAGAKEEKDESSASNQQRFGHQLAEEDNLLLLEVDDDKEERIESRRLTGQVELKDETTVAGTSYGPPEEVSIVDREIGEPSKSLQLAMVVGGRSMQSVSADVAADATDADTDWHASHPSAVREPGAATTPSAGSTPPTLNVMDVEAAGPTQQETTPSTIPDELEWVPCVSDSGHTYYYNRFTQECRWQRPQTAKQRQEAFDAVMLPDSIKLLEHLLGEGLDPNTTSNDGLTLLHMATQTGNERAVELLLSYGAAVESAATITPLLTACQLGQPRIAKLLLESGASPERTDAAGNSALHLAVSSHNCEILREILVAADDRLVNQQNAEGETVLHIAAKLDSAEAVQTLLDHGADLRIEDVQGQSPLIVAILENSVGCAQLLQSVHASVNAVSGTQGAPPAQVITTFAASEENENDVDKLLASIVPAPESCDHEVLEALRSFADETQRAISTLEDQLQEKKRNEKNYHAQIQSLSSSLQAASNELEEEKQMRLQTESAAASKASEHEILRALLMATVTRCSMLESVARDAHAKLRMERKERARSEDVMNDRLQQLLEENASLLQSLYALQTGSGPSASETRLFVDRPRQRSRQGEVIKKTSAPARYAQYPDGPSTFGDHDQSPQTATDHSYPEQQPPRHVTFAEVSVSNRRNKREEVRTGSMTADYSSDVAVNAQDSGQTPPSRVGAVWNRFYENLGQVSARDLAGGSTPSQAGARTNASVFDAIRRSDLQQLQTLVLAGTSPNQHDPTEKGTPLHLACELGDLDAVMLLCEFAADLEARDEEDNTPLLTACAQGNFECTKFLLQSAASLRAVNASGQTALHLAAWDGSAECVTILIEYGIDTSMTNSFGLTALGNLKTRSPLRHKLDDMAPDHPIRATIRILEEHEAQQGQQESEAEGQRRPADVAPLASPPPAPRSTWKEWFFGVKAPAAGGIANIRGDEVASTDSRDDDGDQELSSNSDAELDASALQTMAYPPLTPPPEVAEALSRARTRKNPSGGGGDGGDDKERRLAAGAAASAATIGPCAARGAPSAAAAQGSQQTGTGGRPGGLETSRTMPMAGSQHPVNIRSALRRNSLVSDPEDMLLLREKLTRIAVGSLAARQQDAGDKEEEEEEEEEEDEFDEHGAAGRYGARRRRRPPPFQVFGLPPGERPSTPPSSPQPRDVLRRQLRLKKQVSASRRRLGSASVAGSDEEEDGERSGVAGRKHPLSATFVSVDEVEITRLEEAVGEASIAPPSVSVAAVSPTQAARSASSPRVRLSIPSHLRLSSTFSVLSKCPEGMRKRKSVHVEEAAAAPVAASRHAMSRQGGGSLKKTSSQVNMLSHEHADDLGGRIFKSYSSGALFHRVEGDDSDDQDMEDAWPDPEPPESPEASLGHPEK